MDDLNSQQIVLLTLLVSFVTSIATGITTVALLEQAPDPVIQTINRVVEKTVERVISEPSEKKEIIVEKEIITVVVNEEDLTIEAIEKNSKSLVRIYAQTEVGKNFLTLGIVSSVDGNVVTDSTQITEGTNYVGVFETGEFPLSLKRKSATTSLALLSINYTEGSPKLDNFYSATLANSSSLKIGQSVISLSGEARNSVSTGIINKFNTESDSNTISKIQASVSESNVLLGSVILNLKGEVVGMKLRSEPTESTLFTSINVIKNFLSEKEQEIAA